MTRNDETNCTKMYKNIHIKSYYFDTPKKESVYLDFLITKIWQYINACNYDSHLKIISFKTNFTDNT